MCVHENNQVWAWFVHLLVGKGKDLTVEGEEVESFGYIDENQSRRINKNNNKKIWKA